MPEPVFTYSPHATDNLALRELERTWVERTILAPESTEPDPNHPGRIRAYRTLPECGGRVLRVVFVIRSAGTYHIITVFLDRGRRRKSREVAV